MKKSSLSVLKMHLILLPICFSFCSLSAQVSDPIAKPHKNKLWTGLRLGPGQSNFKGVDEWLVSEGLSSVNQNRVHQFSLGIDLFYEIKKVPIGFTVCFNIANSDELLRSSTEIGLQSGYKVLSKKNLSLKALMGVGVSYMSMDLPRTPNSFITIAASYSDPYPRATILFLNPSVMFEYNPFEGKKALRPFFYFNAGYKQFLNHRWKYGEISNDNTSSLDDGGSFSGLPVGMPNFLKNNLFMTFGVGIGFY